MQKYWLLMASITLSISMLAACNTSEDTNSGQGNTSSEVEEVEQEETTTPEETVEEAEEESTEETNSEEVAEERGPEKTLSFSVKGEAKEETATLTNSDEQNYSIYKLEGFELTGEEPNKDSLYLTENDAVFMRIETLSKADASIDFVRENMLQTMAAVSIGSEPVTIEDDAKLPQGNGISNQSGAEVVTDLGTVSGIVFEQGDLIVRLTIFDRKNESMTDAFLKMGETIGIKE